MKHNKPTIATRPATVLWQPNGRGCDFGGIEMTNDERKEKEALQTAQDLESTGNTGTADFFRWLAENEKDAESLNKHWTCKKCFGNNGDDNIDDFGICKGCRDKEVDK